MTDTELRRLAEESNDANIVWWTPSNLRSIPIDDESAAFIAAASPDVVIGLLDRIKALEDANEAYDSAANKERRTTWHDDATGALMQATYRYLTGNEARECELLVDVAITLRDFFRGVRIDSLRERCERAERERDARPAISREDAAGRLFDHHANTRVENALRAHAAKGGCAGE